MSETFSPQKAETSAQQTALSERRRHRRSSFTYPVEFKLFLQNPLTLKGFLRDISLGGSCLEFDDPFHRVPLGEALNATLKLNLSVPGIDKMSVLGTVRWMKKVEDTTTVRAGIELKEVSMYQIELICKLMGLRNRDQSMLWNLWEEYQNRPEP